MPPMPHEQSPTLTIAQLLEQFKAVVKAQDEIVAAEETGREAPAALRADTVEAQQNAADAFLPLLQEAVKADMITFEFCPEDSEDPSAAFIATGITDSFEGQILLEAELVGHSNPAPVITLGDGEQPLDSRQFMRIPILAFALYRERWSHEDHNHDVLHNVAILSDPTALGFSPGDYEYISTTPAVPGTFAVYGATDPGRNLNDLQPDVNDMESERKIELLGYQYAGVEVNWYRRLNSMQEWFAQADADERDGTGGVWMGGEFKELPRLRMEDIRRPHDDEDKDS